MYLFLYVFISKRNYAVKKLDKKCVQILICTAADKVVLVTIYYSTQVYCSNFVEQSTKCCKPLKRTKSVESVDINDQTITLQS
jgi:hypothetical protein